MRQVFWCWYHPQAGWLGDSLARLKRDARAWPVTHLKLSIAALGSMQSNGWTLRKCCIMALEDTPDAPA